MANLILPSKQISQPSSTPAVDRKNPFGKSLVGYIVGDGKNQNNVTTNGTINRNIKSNKVCSSASSASSSHSLSIPIPSLGTGNLTDFVLVKMEDTEGAATYAYACGSYDGTNGTGISVAHGGAGTNYGWMVYDTGAPGLNVFTGNEIIPHDGNFHFLVHTRNGTTHKAYRNGVEKGSISGANGNTSSAKFCQNNLQETGGPFSCISPIALSGRLNRALTDVEVIEFSRNPWQLFSNPARRLWEGLVISTQKLYFSSQATNRSNTY